MFEQLARFGMFCYQNNRVYSTRKNNNIVLIKSAIHNKTVVLHAIQSKNIRIKHYAPMHMSHSGLHEKCSI